MVEPFFGVIPTYGNYGGPGFMGGAFGGNNANIAPKNGLDLLYQKHDISYGIAENKSNERYLRYKADLELYRGTAEFLSSPEGLALSSADRSYAQIAVVLFRTTNAPFSFPGYSVVQFIENYAPAGVAQYIRCFPGNTPILMADGTTKPIHAIDLGDWIMALDPAQPFAGLVPRQVTRLYRNTTDTWLKLTFLDGGTLSATPGHEMLAAPSMSRESATRFLDEDMDHIPSRFARLDQLVSWQADGTGRVTLVGESGEMRPARVETISFSAATAHLYPLADAAVLAQGFQAACQTFGNLALKVEWGGSEPGFKDGRPLC